LLRDHFLDFVNTRLIAFQFLLDFLNDSGEVVVIIPNDPFNSAVDITQCRLFLTDLCDLFVDTF